MLTSLNPINISVVDLLPMWRPSLPKNETRSLHSSPLTVSSTFPSIQSNVVRLLIGKLEHECKAYCILTGYDRMPESFESDIDFMVDRQDFKRVPALIEQIAKETGSRLFQSRPHEVSARAYILALQNDTKITLVQPDSSSDYRHYGRLWLRADEVLAARRWHPNGFWIPSASHEFIYYLIKRINKGDFTQHHGERLSRLYAEDPESCKRQLTRFWSKRYQFELTEMAASCRWESLIHDLAQFCKDLLHHTAERLFEKPSSYWMRAHHTLERIQQPTGGWIAFIGPDGCGKSSVIEGVADQLAPAFQNIVRFHLRPAFLRARATAETAVVDPHGRPPRGNIFSISKMFYLAVDYIAGYWVRVKPSVIRTKLVIFDRYFYDILIDHRRVRYGGPLWMLSIIAKVLPEPELVLLLNAPAEVLWSRKQEVAFEEVVRQQEKYLRLAQSLKSAVIIDAAQPLNDVIRDSTDAIISYFSNRTAVRLKLIPKNPSSNLD